MRGSDRDPLAVAPASAQATWAPAAFLGRAPRACHLITRLIQGGAQRLALETAACLRDRGWEVELWAGPQTGPEGSLWQEAEARGLRLKVIPALVREVSPLQDLRAYTGLVRSFRRHSFDLVHTHSSKAGILGRLAAARADVPIRIHSVHGWGITPETGAPDRALFTTLERLAARRCHALIAVSQAVRNEGIARRIGIASQYRVIHGAVEVAAVPGSEVRERIRRELRIPENAVVLGTIGRLDHAKDPLGSWEALRTLLEADPRLWVVYVGDGRLREAPSRAIGRCSAGDRVRLAGFHAPAAELLPGFDLFFLGSRWEGFPLAVLEAMGRGLPVVAYAVAGVREAVVDQVTGHLAEPGDREGWRGGIARLAASRELRLRMGAAGRERVASRFTLPDMLARTLDLYRELVEARLRP
ncbi:MAG: glycosyltransferase family 4 protein [Candidatus Eisenbacteria bacterium]